MSAAELVAALVNEPFHLRLDDVAKLTDFQLEEVYFRPERDAKPAGATPVSAFYSYWWALRKSGNDDAEVVRRWQLERPGREPEAVIDLAWEAPKRG